MNIRDMQCFQALVEEKSINQASKSLYMSPQGLSKILKNLENELDCQLIIRTRHGIKPTPAGTVFYEKTKHILKDYHMMQLEIRALQNDTVKTVELLSAYGILRFVTPECINAFKKEHPDISFSYREYPDLDVERRFQKGEGDVAFSLAPFEEGLYDVETMFSYPLKLLVNKKHPYANKKEVTIMDLKDQDLYLESSEFKLYHNIVNRCRRAGFEPNILFETSGFSLCHKMCRDNKGITVTVDFVSRDLSGSDLAGNDMVLLPFTDDSYTWDACILTRKDSIPSPAVCSFRNHVRQWIKRIQTHEYIR